MATPLVRRVDAPPAALATGRFADAGYAWACECLTQKAISLTPEQWARAVFEGSGLPLRAFMLFGWKVGLGLKMGSLKKTSHVLGWPIVDSDRGSVTLEASSRIVDTQNVIVMGDAGITWITRVRFTNIVGRALWVFAAPIHQYLICRALKRVARSAAES